MIRALLIVVSISTTANASIHPDMVMRDADGTPVVESGGALSTMQSCGGCHDTAWIETHSAHAWLGMDEHGTAKTGRSFDAGTGALDRWDPFVYDRVAFDGDFTIGVADWLRRHGARHVGGGFATTDDQGRRLLDLETSETPSPWTHVRGEGDAIQAWDWRASGVAEMNCFVCHLDAPDDDARVRALTEGDFGVAATATLGATGIVDVDGARVAWDRAAFDAKGAVSAARLGLGAPTSDNCGTCHGTVVTRVDEPFFVAPDARRRGTETTGAIFAPGRIARSGMNVVGRDTLRRAWDVHAERLVQCSDCHASINDPAVYAAPDADRPAHLRIDARRSSTSEYLLRPSHHLAKGYSAQGTIRDDLDGSIRTCRDCHDASTGHAWLPYRDRHFDAMECTVCHVPHGLASARRTTDWTVLTDARAPRVLYRGAHGDPTRPGTLLEGYRPVLMPRDDGDGGTRLAPHNLVTTWAWFDAARARPVTREELEAAWFAGDTPHPDIVAALDATGDGRIGPDELGLRHPHQVQAVAARLRAAGVTDPRIRAEVQPFTVAHGVAGRAGATRACATCHAPDSRVGEAFVLADFAPGDVLPDFVDDAGVGMAGDLVTNARGHVVYRPAPAAAGVVLLGSERVRWADRLGLLALALVVGGVGLHGGLRVVLWSIQRRRASVPAPEPRPEAAR